MKKIIALSAGLFLWAASAQAFDDGATYGTARTEINAKAPGDATYLCQTANGTLSAEQALSALASGLMFVTTATGAVTSVPVSANVLTLLGSANYAAMTGLPYVVTETDPTALLTADTDNVKDTHIDWGSGAGQVDSSDIGALPLAGGTLTGKLGMRMAFTSSGMTVLW